MKSLTPVKLLAALKRCQYHVFEGELNLNLIGIRHTNTSANTFNDAFVALYQVNGQWQLAQFKCTTDPGVYYRNNPLNIDGTAIVVPMQHRSLWTFGYHQGKYPALVQNKPITVFRDANKDNELNTDVALTNQQTGYFGINCHRASSKHESQQVDKWSAGCQVLANPKDFEKLMSLCKQSSQQWGNTFTYTLLEQTALTTKNSE
ncbi:hypothetical protein CJF42_22165 [Pseudoalteromonas sp. NBT06-2]|uniref:hypothetical protein n=1 Tax=Pseudoalteromonas sp. NBT06-2 TaxID=2025950 RepID=UPI000BA51389|nr:hypothetical protein [Pseudoalteromonas sp. NBT06-2]PAJ72262.1 hypothetical protein CJF42_22165 [Pseudoalteromonas sp. NBT06-2]